MSTDNYYSAIIILGCVASKYKRAQYRGPKGYFSVKLEAKDKAEQLAELAGVKLGKPTYISEGLYCSEFSLEVLQHKQTQ